MSKKESWFHVQFLNTGHACECCPDEDGLSLLGKFKDRVVATYELEGWLNRWWPLWYYNEFKDEYINRATGACVGRIVKKRE